jgi:adenylate cyclase
LSHHLIDQGSRVVANRPLLAALLLWLAGLVVALAISLGGAGRPIDLLCWDLLHQWSGERWPAERVAIVAVDEASLNAYPDTPVMFWTPIFARAAANARAAGARVVAFDFLFSISAERWLASEGVTDSEWVRTYESHFRQQLASGEVILAAALGDQGDLLLPTTEFLFALPDYNLAGLIGLANLHTDPDGAVRRFSAIYGDGGDGYTPNLSLAALAVRAAGGEVNGPVAPESEWISWLGPPGTVPRLPIATVAAEGFAKTPAAALLRDRIVLVGVEYAGFKDSHPTPWTRSLFSLAQHEMPGVEIHAQIAEGLLQGRVTSEWPLTAQFALSATLLLPFAWWVVRRPPLAAFALALLWLSLPPIAAALLFQQQTLFSPSAGVAAILAMITLATVARLSHVGRERMRITRLFSHYLSPKLVERMAASGRMPELGGESVEATVLFSDIRGFTTLSEQLPATEVVALLNRYFDRACDVIDRHEGSIDKFIGDAIMVEFGAPVDNCHHASNALAAALELVDVAAGMREWLASRYPDKELQPFRIGVGIHTGELVFGNIGSRRRMEFTAIGDAVNLASRLEGMSKTIGCEIVVSEATWQQADHERFQFGEPHEVQARGRSASSRVYPLLADRSRVATA